MSDIIECAGPRRPEVSVLTDRLLEGLGSFIVEVERTKGPFRLVILLRDANKPRPGQWSLMMSAPWMDELGPRVAMPYCGDLLETYVGPPDRDAIETLSSIESDDEFVDAVNRRFGQVESEAIPLRDAAVPGYRIPHGLLLVSRRAA